MSNRIPKYRAWHKAEKVMCEATTITKIGAFLVGVKPGADQELDIGVIYAPKDGRFCEMNEIELLEATGLLDKNKKEVFEGDIIKLESGNLRKVVHRQFGFWFDGVKEKGNFPICFFRDGGITEFEIVGNIYQTPDLIA